MQLATEGMSGADLSKIARDARRLARRAKREVSLEDIRSALPAVAKIEGAHRYALAVHEAGHTVVGLCLNHGTYLGTKIVDQIVIGIDMQRGGAAYFEVPSIARRDRTFYLDWLAVTLAGLAAEELVLGSRGDGAGSDLSTATRLATLFEVNLAMGTSLIYRSGQNEKELEELRRFDPRLVKRVDRLLLEQFERAKNVLQANLPFLERVAEKLVKDGQIGPDQVHRLRS